MGSNKKRFIAVLATTIALAAATTLFQNCSGDVAFSSLQSAGVDRWEEEIGGGLIKVTDRFTVRIEKQTMVDMVWIVDNSGSMTMESFHVRNNVLAFANAVSKEARLKMALVSRIGTIGNATYLPESILAAGGLQIDQQVASHNSIEILGSALCPVSSPLFPCAETLTGGKDAGTYTSNYGGIQGSLVNFFRPGAKKIFVFVTDDESSVKGSAFLDFLKSHYKNESPRMFGFVGLGAPSPCQDGTGDEYMWLTNETAGVSYNICDADWSSHFDDLTTAVGTIANYQYELKGTAIKDIISVKVNGVALPATAYTIEKGVLTLNPSVAASLAGGLLEVIYTYIK